MTVRTVYVVECDQPGCDDQATRSYADSPEEAIERARDEHWGERKLSSSKFLDFCPDHKPA